MHHAIHWFEIPATDLARAQAFWGAVLQVEFRLESAGPMQMAIFPYSITGDGVGGALASSATMRPSERGGVVVYLNAGQDLAGALARVVAAGGQVVQPLTDIGNPGFIALVRDVEGNVVGLHQPRAAA